MIEQVLPERLGKFVKRLVVHKNELPLSMMLLAPTRSALCVPEQMYCRLAPAKCNYFCNAATIEIMQA
jgi:hypothetical protein